MLGSSEFVNKRGRPIVFISHAGIDLSTAEAVRQYLLSHNVDTLMDRTTLTPGDSIVRFIDAGIGTADYFLLLWSQAAAQSVWVAEEWEAALCRAIREHRAFLMIGRLDLHPLPTLLSARLTIDLFPSLEPGIERLVTAWTHDRSAELQTQRPVGSTLAVESEEPSGQLVYLTSELFDLAVPRRFGRKIPLVLIANLVAKEYGLPKSISHQGRVGLDFHYNLAFNGKILPRTTTLEESNIPEGAVLELYVQVGGFTVTKPIGSGPEGAWFRAAEASGNGPSGEEVQSARGAFQAALGAAGLAPLGNRA